MRLFNFIKRPLPIGNGTENAYLVQPYGPPATSYLGWGGELVQRSFASTHTPLHLDAKMALLTDVYAGYQLNGSALLLPLTNAPKG